MGPFLVVLAHSERGYPTKLWVVDLLDNSFQEDKGVRWQFDGLDTLNYSLNKYGENQIIKFGGGRHAKSTNRIVWMTIDSFKRKKIFREPLLMSVKR